MSDYIPYRTTVYPKKYTHGFLVLCFVVVMQSFIMNSHEVFIHIHQGCFAGTGAIVRLPQCQWSKPDGYGKISPCITTTKHNKAKTVCIFLGIYCILVNVLILVNSCKQKGVRVVLWHWSTFTFTSLSPRWDQATIRLHQARCGNPEEYESHDDVIKWKHFRVTAPLCGEFTGKR